MKLREPSSNVMYLMRAVTRLKYGRNLIKKFFYMEKIPPVMHKYRIVYLENNYLRCKLHMRSDGIYNNLVVWCEKTFMVQGCHQ